MPTSAEFASVKSIVIPTDILPRPQWESRSDVLSQFESARTRVPRVTLPSTEKAQQVLDRDTPGIVAPNWFRALCDLPIAMDAWIQRQSMVREGRTPVDLRLKIAWVCSRENRAWYSAAHTRERFLAMGGLESALDSFDSLIADSSQPGHAESLRFALKLTSSPHTIEDADIVRLKEHFSDHEVAEIIQVVCDSNGFDRFTEALNLPLEF